MRHDIIEPDHTCSWTRRWRSRLSRSGNAVSGGGLSLPVIRFAAQQLGFTFEPEPNPSDEYGQIFSFGSWHGSIHDGCLVHIEPVGDALLKALVGAMIALHAFYLGHRVPQDEILAALLPDLRDGTTLDLRSVIAKREIVATIVPISAGWLDRIGVPKRRFKALDEPTHA